MTYPNLETFLTLPDVEVATISPTTVIAIFGGISRSAALAGIDRQSTAYMPWLRTGMLACFDLLFRHGVRHIIAPLTIARIPPQVQAFRDRLLAAIAWGFAGPEALSDYAQRAWRVRLLGTDDVPELTTTADRLRSETSRTSETTLWFSVCADAEAPLQTIFNSVLQSGPRSRIELIRVLYGEDIPLATMLIGFGKPTFVFDLVPPLLVGQLQCYWTQRAGYGLDERMLRRILYDYAYTRQTGSGTERNGRYANIQAQRAAWETDWVLGVGVLRGASWYPASFAGPPEDIEFLCS
jgi:hypothetical protein